MNEREVENIHDTASTPESANNFEIMGLITNSDIPKDLKLHFCDIINIMGGRSGGLEQARQIYNISEEFNLAKRVYLESRHIESDPKINELIYNVILKLSEIHKPDFKR
jgi:hypothetical protein